MSYFHVVFEGPYQEWEKSITKKLMEGSHSFHLTHFESTADFGEVTIEYLKSTSMNMNRASIDRIEKEFSNSKTFDTVIYWNAYLGKEDVELFVRHKTITRHEIRSRHYLPQFFITLPPTFDRISLFWKQSRFPTKHLWWRWLRKLNIETVKV